MNINVVRAVWKRDLQSWFGNPTGFVFIVLFVLACCLALLFSNNGAFFTNGLANLDTLTEFWFPIIAVVFVSAATMNVWASERSNGTQELLFTLPATDLELQLGKYLAAASVYTISLLFTLVMPIALVTLGNPDWGQLFANYVGFWLLGVMLVSASMVGSQLTQNGTIALLLSLIICSLVVGLGSAIAHLGWLGWLDNGPLGQFALFAGGEIPFSGVLLFVGLTVAFFYLGLWLLGRRSWRDPAQGVHGGLRFVGLAVAAGALTIIGVNALPRIDATVEGIHSLGAETEALLAELDDEDPVYITAFVSEQMPEQFVQQKKLLLNLLDQFDAIGGGAVQKQVILPEPYSPEARHAESEFGIRPQQVSVPLPGGGFADLQMYLGFVVQSGTNEIVTPFVGPAVPLEYELMRSVRTVSKAERRKVGILKTDVELFGGFDMQTFQQKPRWAIAEELDHQYEIVNVDPASEYPDDLDCLVVPQGSSLEQEPMTRLQQYVLAGNPTILFEDPMPLGAPGTAADDPKGGPQARMMGGGGPPKGNWVGFCDAIGVRAPIGEIAWDTSYRTFPGGDRNPYLQWSLFLRAGSFSEDHVVTSGLQSVLALMGGHVESAGKDGVTFEPLLWSRPAGGNGVVRKSDLFVSNFFGGQQLNPSPPRRVVDDEIVVAARVTSAPASGGDDGPPAPGLNVVYVADLDMIGDMFFQIRRQFLDANMRFDNVTFALNCIDTLVGDESLIELRKRRPILRKLTAVEEAQLEFEKQWQKQKDAAEEEAKEALAEADKRFQDAVDKIEQDSGMDLRAKRQKIEEVRAVEQKRLDLKKAQIEEEKKRTIEEAQHDRNAARQSIHERYQYTTLALAMLPGVLLGLLTWFRRNQRAAAIVPQNRKVQGGN